MILWFTVNETWVVIQKFIEKKIQAGEPEQIYLIPEFTNRIKKVIRRKSYSEEGRSSLFILRLHAGARSICWECDLTCRRTRFWQCCISCSGTGVPPGKRKVGRCGRDSRASWQNDRPQNDACILSESGNACQQILSRSCPVTIHTEYRIITLIHMLFVVSL